jgi:hypothetical protein
MCLTHTAVHTDLFWHYYRYYMSESMKHMFEQQMKLMNDMIIDTIVAIDIYDSVIKKYAKIQH